MTKILSFLLSGLFCVCAQTKIDLKTQSYGAVVGAPEPQQRVEDEWCPRPTFERVDGTHLKVFPTISAESPCYLHFSAIPVGVAEFTTTATVTLGAATNDLLFLYWQLENGAAKMYVSAVDPTVLTCTGCTLVRRTEPSFPKASIVLGLYGVIDGQFAVSGHPIINSHQVGFDQATGALITYYPTAGYVFQVQPIVPTAPTVQAQNQLARAAADLEVARTNAQIRQLDSTGVPEQRLAEVEEKVGKVEARMASVAASIPPSTVDVQRLQIDLTNAKAELQSIKDLTRQALQSYIDAQLEQVTLRYQQAQRELASQAAGTKVAPPKVAKDKCNAGEWALDTQYKYECLSGVWYRFSRDSTWR